MARDRIDLTGGRFDRLLVTSEAPQIGKNRYWNCLCDCGNEKIIPMKNLRSEKTKSCGCLQRENLSLPKFKDLTNQIFERLTALHRDGDKLSSGSIVWVCRCSCDNKLVSVASRELVSGNTQSCGCLQLDHIKSLEDNNKETLSVDGVFVPILKQKLQSNSSTGVKGVSVHHNKNGKVEYMANITIKGKRHYLGLHNKMIEATNARRAAEEKYHKPYIDKFAETIVCAAPDCDVRFKPVRKGQEYHLPKCRYRHHKQILRQKRIDLGLCPQCGSEMSEGNKSKHCDKCTKYYKSRYKGN